MSDELIQVDTTAVAIAFIRKEMALCDEVTPRIRGLITEITQQRYGLSKGDAEGLVSLVLDPPDLLLEGHGGAA